MGTLKPHQLRHLCRSCAGLNFAHSPNAFLDEASAISVIARLNLFFLGPGMTLISDL